MTTSRIPGSGDAQRAGISFSPNSAGSGPGGKNQGLSTINGIAENLNQALWDFWLSSSANSRQIQAWRAAQVAVNSWTVVWANKLNKKKKNSTPSKAHTNKA